MDLNEIKVLVSSDQYGFLRENEHLGKNIILLGLGGSHAYGTDIEGSDVDVRGCALNGRRELLTNVKFEQFTNEETDTVIYGFNKLIHLLSNCNPNVIEMLGLKPEHYLYISPIGQELIDHAYLFLSQKAFASFGGYATAQLRRLQNKTVRDVGQEQREKHILNSIECASQSFPEKYFGYEEDEIQLYVDKTDREHSETEIFMDVNLHHYPLRDYKCMWSEMNEIVKSYATVGKRNKSAAEHGKIAKHMMHLIRLYLMCLDILEKGEIVTYREKEHDLLMEIRAGKYLDEHDQPIPEFYEMVDEYEKKLEEAKKHTDLPAKPDCDAINDFVVSVNERVVRGNV